MTIMKEAVAAVLDNRDDYKIAKQYYDGEVPEVFATKRLRSALKSTGQSAHINFTRPIVSAVANRLKVGSIAGSTPTATKAIEALRIANDLPLEEQFVHQETIMYGDYYGLVWPDKEGEVQISFMKPENAAIVYDPMNHRVKKYGVQLWRSAENEHRLNILTEDKITKYKAQTGNVTDATQWTHVDTVDNPWGEVPLFHFRTHLPEGRPEHKDAYDLQNAINKLFITNMHTIDYHGAPTRYALSQAGDGGELADFDEDETDRENMGTLKNGPGELWYLKNVSHVGEFKPADSMTFWTPIKESVRTMSAVTDTPLHYFDRTGNNPTGNGLRTAEAPLLKKIALRQQVIGRAWEQLYKFALKVKGIESEVTLYWETNESLDELERWDVALKKINAGLSHKQALREGGYSEEQIAKIMEERDTEAKAGQYYERKPEVRVNTEKDETQEVATDE